MKSTPWQPYPDDPNAGIAAGQACPHPTGQDIYEHLTGTGAYREGDP